jgi:hypothetical protein
MIWIVESIARSIGLKSIPQFDLNAIFRLDGIIEDS